MNIAELFRRKGKVMVFVPSVSRSIILMNIYLREEGRIVIREKILPNNTVLYGCFIHG